SSRICFPGRGHGRGESAPRAESAPLAAAGRSIPRCSLSQSPFPHARYLLTLEAHQPVRQIVEYRVDVRVVIERQCRLDEAIGSLERLRALSPGYAAVSGALADIQGLLGRGGLLDRSATG